MVTTFGIRGAPYNEPPYTESEWPDSTIGMTRGCPCGAGFGSYSLHHSRDTRSHDVGAQAEVSARSRPYSLPDGDPSA